MSTGSPDEMNGVIDNGSARRWARLGEELFNRTANEDNDRCYLVIILLSVRKMNRVWCFEMKAEQKDS